MVLIPHWKMLTVMKISLQRWTLGERTSRVQTSVFGSVELEGKYLNFCFKILQDGLVRTTPIPFTSAADTSILPIVTSQRDRFRQRNAELEEVCLAGISFSMLFLLSESPEQELRRQFQIISELRTEIRSLQADNLKLYEKVRYMQSYRENTTNSTLDPLPAGPSSSAAEMTKYRTRYEESMNPFEAFRGRVSPCAVMRRDLS